MSGIKWIPIVVSAMLLAACGMQRVGLERQWARVVPIHSTAMHGIEVMRSAGTLTITIHELHQPGAFFNIELPAGVSVAAESWTGDGGLLHLIIPTQDGVELGVVPAGGIVKGPVRVALTLAAAPRVVSVPPVGEHNVITDLTVTDVGGGQVTLEWTQVNTGDYDFNGEVNISDLTPLGVNYLRTYERQGPGARELTEYWVDGDANGEINIGDVTPIGVNYGAVIAGYNIRHNGVKLPGQPTVLAGEGIERPGLPRRYSLTAAGSTADEWIVGPVDYDGVEGADSSGDPGPVDLLANVFIDGQLLLDLSGGNPGEFGPGKVSTRVIEPIEEVNIVEVGLVTALPSQGSFTIADLPLEKKVFLQFRYAPAIDLATGAEKIITGHRFASQLSEDDIVTTSIPLSIPAGSEPVVVDAQIDLGTANPAGGFFVHLQANLFFPGDDPYTQPVEDGYVRSTNVRLDYARGFVSTDTDANGDFDDEAELEDEDRDCVSRARLRQELDDDEFDERDEIEAEGILAAFDEASGLITLSNIVVESGNATAEEIELAQPLRFSELTRFEEKIKREGDDIERDIDPSDLKVGDEVEIDLYRLLDLSGEPTDKFWAEKIERRINET